MKNTQTEESGGGLINIDDYLTIEALEDGLTANLSVNTCEYCVDGDDNWKTLSAGTATESINSGQTLSFRGNLTPASSKGIGTFTIDKKCNLKGNCMSMLFGDNAVDNYSLSGKSYAFSKLFYNCTNIVNVSSNFLPATTLAERCYLSMFYGCTSLTTASALPATTLASSCYREMFYGCTSLTTAPNLPATALADWCYYSIFKDCTSLTTAPTLPATTLASNCYGNMFNNCRNLTTAPELPANTISDYCYTNMFDSCISLTTAPELPATTLATQCYTYMFYGCAKLNYIKMLATNISASYCLYEWVRGVAAGGTFVKNSAMTSLPTASSSNHYAGIPEGWDIMHDRGDGSYVLVFEVFNKEYEAELEMTWEEWVNSDYNIDGFTIKNGIVYYPDGYHYVGYINAAVSITDIISSTEDYYYLGGDDGSGD